MASQPTIVVLDGFTLNPGDLSWDGLNTIGTCRIYDRTSPDDILPRARDAGIVLTNKVILDRDTIYALPHLRYIGVMATGFNVVDLETAKDRGITVTNVPEYATQSVVQHVFAFLLSMTHNVCLHSQSVHEGEWADSPDFSYWKRPLVELSGMTMGIIGFGRIGRVVAQTALAFGMKVLATDVHEIATGDPAISFTPLDSLLRSSDVVSLHCPLTTETAGLINRDRLRLMKPESFLINTGRGQLICEEDLTCALNEDRIAGAALDVLSSEPPSPNNPLFRAKNCIITPHIGWASQASRRRLMRAVAGNVHAFLDEKPINIVTHV